MPRYKKLILVSGVILFLFFLSISFILQRNYVIPILMYHSIVPDVMPEGRLSVSVESFQRQMRFLKNHNYNVMPLNEVADFIKYKKKVPPKTVAITLDDGYKDNYTNVFPILKKYNLPATIFIIVNEVGRKQGDRLSWGEIKIMQDSGLITIGSHTLWHKLLVDLKSEQAIRKEIFESKKILEKRLGRAVEIFSYPAGRFNSKIRQLVIGAGYKMAVATNPGKKYANDDVFALKRLRISYTSDNLFIFWIEASGFYNFMRENRHK